jgi:hypothetical protein
MYQRNPDMSRNDPSGSPHNPAGNQSGKNIVILSTEPWGKMLLSKMHYAIELVGKGNKVFFVNPPMDPALGSPRVSGHPDKAGTGRLATVIEEREGGNLVIIETRPIAGSLFFRHKLFPVFRMISRRYVKAIKKIVGSGIYEVWCFNPHIYVDLHSFGADRAMLLIYDFYKGDHVFKAAQSSDAIISISQLIIDFYNSASPPKLLLQHGLGKHFADRARKRLQDGDFGSMKRLHDGGFTAIADKKIRIGYMGNLLRVGMNTEVARRIIERHKDKEFHFWGPYSLDDNNVNGSGASIPDGLASFIVFLEGQQHVFMHGVKEQEALAAGLAEMDAFLFLYSPRTEMNSASNSHKLLEYLSTGKVIVSTHVSNYAGTDLLVMSDKDEEDNLPELFNKVMNELSIYNDIERQKERIAFALDNTYVRQVERIQQFIHRQPDL